MFVYIPIKTDNEKYLLSSLVKSKQWIFESFSNVPLPKSVTHLNQKSSNHTDRAIEN